MRHSLMILLALAWLGATAGAWAQTVWRCGADARSFSDRPCADGQALPLAALADTRSAAQVNHAHEVAARERRLAEGLRQERLARERAVALTSQDGRRSQRRVAHAAGEAATDEGLRPTAQSPSTRPASRKARAPRALPATDGTWPATARASRRNRD